MPENTEIESTTTEGPEAEGVDQAVAELIDDYSTEAEPGDTPEPTSKAASELAAESQPTPPRVVAEPAPAAPTAQPQPQPVFTYQGRRYTKDEILQALSTDERFLASTITSAEQLPHLTRRHQEVLERQGQILEHVAQQRQREAAQSAPAPDPVKTLEQMRHAFEPQVREAVTKGILEEEVAQLYPNAVTHIFAQQHAIAGLRETVAELVREIGGSRQERAQSAWQREVQEVHSTIDGAIAQASAKGGLYEGLKDPAVVEGFKTYLWEEVDPTVDKLANPRFVERQFIAYQNEIILAERQAAEEREAQTGARTRARAVGAGHGGPRPSNTRQAQVSEFEEIALD